MGVSGSGKSTLACRLAQQMDGSFIEGDDHHSESSRDKMRRGIALCDSDREPWLDQLSAVMQAHAGTTVLSCSALKHSYRARLRNGVDNLGFVFLDIALPAAIARVSHRPEHEFPASLVADQFAVLEPPHGEPHVLFLSAEETVEHNLEKTIEWIGIRTTAPMHRMKEE
jgi:gluconokinase